MSLVVGALLPAAAVNANDDPFESLNRDILKFNDAVDKVFLRPIAVVMTLRCRARFGRAL